MDEQLQVRRRIFAAAVVMTVAAGLLCGPGWALAASASEPAALPRITANELGLVINDNDPQSVQVGAYYQQRRSVPAENVLRVRIPVSSVLSPQDFARVQRQLRTGLPKRVQVLALAWSQPYRVDCMSITAAFASGFDGRTCADGCRPTPFSPYFDSRGHAPYETFGIRPTMLLAARNYEQARELIDRGIASDGTAPRGTAYLLDTSDASRNRRAGEYGFARGLAGDGVGVQVLKADSLQGRSDVLFYFTGMRRVADLHSNRFLPGALADHLTSTGGVLSGTDQMSSIDWLEAGAAASYGTVVEPCNFPGKFPNVSVVMQHYLDGETAIESYWKSVLMPSQGLFIGEPLAAPFRGSDWVGIHEARRQLHAASLRQ